MRQAAELTVVVCCYTDERWSDILAAVGSVQDQEPPVGQIVVVVDHNPALLERLTRTLPDVRVVANRHPQGLAGARNTGIEEAAGAIVAFLDDDARAEAGWARALVAGYASSDVLGVGGTVVPQWSAGRPAWFPQEFDWVVGCSFAGSADTRMPVRNFIGANMSLRRDVLQALGGFSTALGRSADYPAGCEETELCIRATRHFSGELRHEPDAVVVHSVPAARGRLRYLRRRCHAEGRSKAIVAQLTGPGAALSSERRYVTRVLPAGVGRGALCALKGKPAGLCRAAIIIFGLAVTTLGFIQGRGPARGMASLAASDGGSTGEPSPRRRFSVGALDPVARNGYRLILTTVITAVTGVLYWIFAAHLFPAAQVGRQAGALTTMTLIAAVAAMNMTGALSYLLPRSGSSAGRWVRQTYTAAVGLAAVLAGALLLYVHSVHTSLSFLTDNTALAFAFLLSAPFATLFVLQDGVLVGLQRSSWVLTENVIFAAVKLGCLVAAGSLAIGNGIFFSWVVPMILAVPVVSVFIVRRLLPTTRGTPDRTELSARSVRRFIGLTSAAGLLHQAWLNLLPLVVLATLGSTANAAFYIAWTIAVVLDTVSQGMGASLTVEASAAPPELARHTRDVIRRLGLLLLPGVIIAVLIAPQFLQLYGGHYASSATTLFRLLMLAVLPRAFVVIAQSATRAQGKAWLTVLTEAGTAVIVLGVAIPLLHRFGIDAVGYAWLLANVAMSAACIPSILSCLKTSSSLSTRALVRA